MSVEKYGFIPVGWLFCSAKAKKLILNKFLAFKTPLSYSYNKQIPEQDRFDVHMLFENLSDQSLRPTLWIDLTSTTKFYEWKTIEEYDCQYIKLECQTNDGIPSREHVRTFMKICADFIARKPLKTIGIHCSDGFNTTGFFIVSYLIEKAGFNIHNALKEFADARPPGIFDDNHVHELYRRYDKSENAPFYPMMKPPWYFKCRDLTILEENVTSRINVNFIQKERHTRENQADTLRVFMPGVSGVTPVLDQEKISRIQKRVGEICAWDMNTGFPGTQPIFLNDMNIRTLQFDSYRVSWISAGIRYVCKILQDICTKCLC